MKSVQENSVHKESCALKEKWIAKLATLEINTNWRMLPTSTEC